MAMATAVASSTTSTTLSPSALLHSYEVSAPQASRIAFLPSATLSAAALRSKHCSSTFARRNPSPHPLLPVRAVSAIQEPTTASPDEASATKTKYYFLVANAKFMLDEEEHFQELLKERLRNFEERDRKQDFWIVIEPKFLENFPDFTKRLSRPAVALVSTDYLWITFMKLRLDRVLRGEIEAETLSEAVKSNPVNVDFEKPQTWTAPYTKYAGGWWTPFLPPQEG